MGLVPDAPGVWGRVSPFGANMTTTTTFLRGHLGTGTASGMLRIARADITNWIGVGASSGAAASNNTSGGGGVPIAQIPFGARSSTDPAYNPETQAVVVFKFGFTLGGADTRSMRLWAWTGPSGPWAPPEPQLLRGRWFADLSESSPFLRGHLGTGTAAGMLRIARAGVTNWIGEGPTSGAGAANNTNGGGGVSVAHSSGARAIRS